MTAALRDAVSADLRATLRALKLGQMLGTLPDRLTLPGSRRWPTPTSYMASAAKLFKRLKAARLDNTLDYEMRRLAGIELLILDLSRPWDYPDRAL